MERNIFIRLRIENAERLLETTGESASEIMCRGDPGERQAGASVLAKFQVALDRKCWTLSLAGTAGRVL